MEFPKSFWRNIQHPELRRQLPSLSQQLSQIRIIAWPKNTTSTKEKVSSHPVPCFSAPVSHLKIYVVSATILLCSRKCQDANLTLLPPPWPSLRDRVLQTGCCLMSWTLLQIPAPRLLLASSCSPKRQRAARAGREPSTMSEAETLQVPELQLVCNWSAFLGRRQGNLPAPSKCLFLKPLPAQNKPICCVLGYKY